MIKKHVNWSTDSFFNKLVKHASVYPVTPVHFRKHFCSCEKNTKCSILFQSLVFASLFLIRHYKTSKTHFAVPTLQLKSTRQNEAFFSLFQNRNDSHIELAEADHRKSF